MRYVRHRCPQVCESVPCYLQGTGKSVYMGSSLDASQHPYEATGGSINHVNQRDCHRVVEYPHRVKIEGSESLRVPETISTVVKEPQKAAWSFAYFITGTEPQDGQHGCNLFM
eukprot:scaffold25484_cov21-Tisochrysis_lutea.AAC.1